jgi:hypothetical protein
VSSSRGDDLRKWVEDMRRQPVAQRFVRRATAGQHRVCNTPEDVLGSRLVLLSNYLAYEDIYPGKMRLPAYDDRAKKLLNRVCAAIVAPPYLWPSEIMNAVGGLPLPRHVISPTILPEPRSWHTFSPPLRMYGHGEREHVIENVIHAGLIEDYGKGFVVTLFQTEDDSFDFKPRVVAMRFPYGDVYPDDFPDSAVSADGRGRSWVELVLSMFAFLNSPYIPTQRQHPNRAVRRELGLGKADPTQDVTFVILRRVAARKTSSDEPPDTVEWKHRWVVSGHYRAQWYPSEQAHRLIWIAPYLKGPYDAPMLEHVYKVVR